MNKLLLIALTVGVFVVEVTVSAESRERRSDDGGPLEVVVEQLSQQVTSLTAQLNSVNTQLTAQLNSVNTQLNSVNTDLSALKSRTDNPVAFYAVNSANPIQTAAGGTLVLNHAVTNVGNAYNTLSGIFTAPVPGLYHFLATFDSAHLGSTQHAYAAIYVDRARMANGISDTQHGHNDQTTISTIVHLTAGQQVYVKNDSGAAKDYLAASVTNPYTTFSGLLLHGD